MSKPRDSVVVSELAVVYWIWTIHSNVKLIIWGRIYVGRFMITFTITHLPYSVPIQNLFDVLFVLAILIRYHPRLT